MNSRDIIITTNSPGELSSWVKVTTEKIKKKFPLFRVIIMLVPCPYASGKEEEIARSIPGVDIVVPPKDFVKFLFGFKPKGYMPSPYGAVVFLGGDFWHALLVSRKMNYPSVAYSARASRWNKFFNLIGVRDEQIKKELMRWGYSQDKIFAIGNLMTEQVRPVFSLNDAQKKWNINPKDFTVGIFPGSRLYHVKESLPYYLKVADVLKEKFGNIQFLLGVSPFLSLENLKMCLKPSLSGLEGTSGEIAGHDDGTFIKTQQGTVIKVLQGYQYDMINLSDLVLTIPGTNTVEIAALRKPMIVSSTWRAKIPRGGLTGFFGSLLLSRYLRKKFLFGVLKRIKFTALPNQIARKKIVPEVIVDKSTSEVTGIAEDLLKDEKMRKNISVELEKVIKETSSSEAMVGLILKALEISPFAWLDSSKISRKFREWVYRWRGWIIAPLALLILFIAKPTIPSLIFGTFVAVLGEFIRIWGVGYAGSTTREGEVVAPQLVTAGPYGFVKNPLYLGNFITGLGFCFMALGKAPLAELVLLPMICILIYFIVYGLIIPLEEGYLYKTFGDSYLKYSKLVPKIIPQLKPYPEKHGRFSWLVIFKTEIHSIVMLLAMLGLMIAKYYYHY